MEENLITETALYLTFGMAGEIFAIDVAQAREVLDLNLITKVPCSVDFMRGVINVRGSVVPVVDLRLKLGLEKTATSPDTRIIVMELDLDGEKTILGALADSVHEVLELAPGQIEPPPTIGSRWRTEFIKGVGKRDEQFIIILDIDQVFPAEAFSTLMATAGPATVSPDWRAAA